MVEDEKHYRRNIKKFDRALREYRPWDYHGLILFITTCLEDMEKEQFHDETMVESDSKAKDMRVCRLMLERFLDDPKEWDKFETELMPLNDKIAELVMKKKFDLPTAKLWSKHDTFVEADTIEMAFKTIGKKILSWWT